MIAGAGVSRQWISRLLENAKTELPNCLERVRNFKIAQLAQVDGA
jgi:hypothetical protein